MNDKKTKVINDMVTRWFSTSNTAEPLCPSSNGPTKKPPMSTKKIINNLIMTKLLFRQHQTYTSLHEFFKFAVTG